MGDGADASKCELCSQASAQAMSHFVEHYMLRNDYMFHAVLQKNEEVLRNLLATLLEMDEADIVSCHIENPIELGKHSYRI